MPDLLMPQALARQHMSLRRARAARACRRPLTVVVPVVCVGLAQGPRPPGTDAEKRAQNCGRDRDGAMSQSSTEEQDVCSPKHPGASQGIRLRDRHKQHPVLPHPPFPLYTMLSAEAVSGRHGK